MHAMRLLGIDPGLLRTGYACVELPPRRTEPRLVEAGVLRLKAGTTISYRLRQLHDDLEELIQTLRPARMAVEQVFSHAGHVRTAIVLGHARGVVLLAAERHGMALLELAPAAVKKAVCGRGDATKRQMQLAVAAQCGLPRPPSPPDVADAIAIALTAARRC